MNEENKKDQEIPRTGSFLKYYDEVANDNKLNRFNSSNPNNILKQLSTPRFLGSYHIKQNSDPRFQSFSNIMKGDHQLSYAKSLKSIIFNPLTILFLIIAIAFNFLWLINLIF